MERKLSRTLDYQADVHESHKRIREIELNKEFTQGYEFINTGDVAWPAEVEILDLDTKETETMVGLKPGQKM